MPDAFHYWTNKYVAVEVKRLFGMNGVIKIYVNALKALLEERPSIRVLSIGCGDANIELGVVEQLLHDGYQDFQLECLELSEILCTRNREKADDISAARHISFQQADLNTWESECADRYDYVIANQILHHVVELEHLFGQLKHCLKADGAFFVRDMIGRNGHVLWPEARQIISAIWATLPEAKRFNRRDEAVYTQYPDIDCSTEGFEGIRAQDILPLLHEHFYFSKFVAFGGIIDKLVGRAFGHSYDTDNPDDLRQIDRYWTLNQTLIELGVLTPTQMVAELSLSPRTAETGFGIAPQHCIRLPEREPVAAIPGEPAGD